MAPKPKQNTPLARYMALHGLTNFKVAKRLRCHWSCVQRWRSGSSGVSGYYLRELKKAYPDLVM